MMQCTEISNLVKILKNNGDQILDASSKLCLSSSLLSKINESFTKIVGKCDTHVPFHVVDSNSHDEMSDVKLLYDFVQKVTSVKIWSDVPNQLIDIKPFRNVKKLELYRCKSSLIGGLKFLRGRLESLSCVRSAASLREVLENCGSDRTEGCVWSKLADLVFCHNDIRSLDAGLEFVPMLSSADLSHNLIKDMQTVTCLSNLKHLNLSFNRIETIPVITGQLSSTLEILILRNNYIDDVRELGNLVNLFELDLSNNCLVEHGSLAPLLNLSSLRHLKLQGNPLSYHRKHRNLTAMYLHVDISPDNFKLESRPFLKSEWKLHGVLKAPVERSPSITSIVSENTIIANTSHFLADRATCNDLTPGLRMGSDSDHDEPQNVWTQTETEVHNGQCMQDSGFVAEPRPSSPSTCSIGKNVTHVKLGTRRPLHCLHHFGRISYLHPTIEKNNINNSVRYAINKIFQ